MKSSYKIIDLSDGATVYTIGPEDNVSRILLTGGSFALDRTVDINWSEGNNAAPLDTMLIINKTLSIQPNSVANGVKIFSHNFRLFGYMMPNDVREYGDMIVCVKVANNKWKLSSFTAINFFGVGGGGIDILDPGTVDETNGMVGFHQKPISVKLTDLVDNSTIKIVGGKLVGSIASDTVVSVMDDFIDATSKEVVNGRVSGSIGGTAIITADDAAGYFGSVSDKETQISRTTNPTLTSYLRFKARGNSEVKIGLLDDFTTPTRGAYFKMSGTSYELFTVVNDGTERIVTSGITASMGTYIKLEIVLRDNGNVFFFINNVLVREETGYAIPDELYKQSVSVIDGSAETLVEIDYMKIDMSRV